MRKHWDGFKNFAFSGDIVGLAVAFVLAAAFGLVIGALVEFILMPLIAAIFGEPSFDALSLTINGAVILYGSFITALVRFILVAAALYFFVVLPYTKYMERGAAPEAPADDPEEIVLLREIRDGLRR